MKTSSDRSSKHPSKARGLVLVAIGAISWGLSGTCVQYLTVDAGIPVEWVSCVRLVASAFVFMCISLVRYRSNLVGLLTHKRSAATVVSYAVFGVFILQLSYMICIRQTNAGTATVLEMLYLPFVLAFVCLHVRRAPVAIELVGVVLSLVGVFLICTQGNATALSIDFDGLIWGLISAVCMAAYTIIPQKIVARWGAVPSTALAMSIAAVISIAVFRPWEYDISFSVPVFFALVVLIVVGTVIAYTLYLRGVVEAGPTLAAMMGSLEPVSASVFSALLLATAFSTFDILGCALVVVMVVLISIAPTNDA